MQPPAPKPVPVPDGPVVKRAELEGGIIAEDLTIGEGYEVQPGGAVVALYHGTLKDGGKVFDSAFDRGEPIAFPLDGVIVGWQKGVPGMKVGGVRRLTIPAALAYGERGAGADIPPNADLIFVIQLVDALQVEDIAQGEGTPVEGQCVPVTRHTISAADGKELAKTAEPHVWLPGEMAAPGAMFDTFQQAVEGMKVGGKRRVRVPAMMNACAPQASPAWTQRVPIVIDFELLAVRNLPARR